MVVAVLGMALTATARAVLRVPAPDSRALVPALGSLALVVAVGLFLGKTADPRMVLEAQAVKRDSKTWLTSFWRRSVTCSTAWTRGRPPTPCLGGRSARRRSR